MADQERSDLIVVSTMILCELESLEMLIILLSELIWVSNHTLALSDAIWSQLVNFSFVTYQIQKLMPQKRIIKKNLPVS